MICDENVEMLQRSALAIAPSSQTSESILNAILSEGVNCLTIKSMGGMQHLLIFDTFEDKKQMMESEWLLQWFMKITNVNDQSATLWRETCISIYGVPLIAWGYKNFFDIGCVFGRVISVDYKNFDCANVRIFTDCLFDTSCKISMEIEGKSYAVHILEKKGNRDKGNNLHQGASQNDVNPPHLILTDQPTQKQNNIKSVTSSLASDTQNFNDWSGAKPDEEEVEQPDKNCAHVTPNVGITEGNSKAQGCNDGCMGKSPTLNDPLIAVEQVAPTSPSQPPEFLKSPSPLPKAQQINPTSPNYPKPTSYGLHSESSPVHNQPSPSPIPLTNRFKSLLRPKTSNSSSSSLSGPIYPPGFEPKIPFNIIRINDTKKKKKKQKKKHPDLLLLKPNQSKLPPIASTSLEEISTSSIMVLAEKLQLQFDGPASDLEARIDEILRQQKSNWDSRNK